MRKRRHFAILALCAGAVLGAGPHASAAGEGEPPHDDDEELVPAPDGEEVPRGAQDGAMAGAAAGLTPASVQSDARPPAMRYAGLDRATCEAELVRRNIGFERVAEARGVVAPLRLTGPVGGVSFHAMLPSAQRRTSPLEIYDCRLVLALDDFSRILARYDVVEVVHYSVYRPPPARQVLHGAGRRHSGALAIDAATFKTRDGRTLDVLKDFHGRIGAKTCGPGAPAPGSLPPNAAALRGIVCDAARAQLFNVVLTPDYNWPHRNHFHLEVTAGARWMFVR